MNASSEPSPRFLVVRLNRSHFIIQEIKTSQVYNGVCVHSIVEETLLRVHCPYVATMMLLSSSLRGVCGDQIHFTTPPDDAEYGVEDVFAPIILYYIHTKCSAQ